MIELNVDKMIANELTASQYLLLELLRMRKDNTIKKYLIVDPRAKEDLYILKHKGYILKMDKSGYIIDQKKCSALIDLKQDNFWELFGVYPIKTYNGNQTRILRNANPDSKLAKECLDKYKRKVKTEGKHRHVMKCLEFELKMRKKEKTLGYMQQLITWLNQNSWEKYESLIEESGSLNLDNTEGYGHTII